MPNSEIKTLTYPKLKAAMEGTAAAFRCVTRLEPAGGPDDKVFPPTYLGGVYAVEKRRVKNANGEGKIVCCVVLDSVQSQANRLEQSLLRAYEAGKLKFPLMVVDFSKEEDGSDQIDTEIRSIGRITTLDAPHRIADAIFRDSVLRSNGQIVPFRSSDEGRAFENSNIRNATALFELCPTALVFGTWDSTGSRGGLGNKFARALVSEIVGIDATVGVRTSSRIDPLGIPRQIQIFDDGQGNWTLQDTGRPFGRNPETRGRPAAINHGNIPPDFPRYSRKDAENENPDALKSSSVALEYAIRSDDGKLQARAAVQSDEVRVREGAIKAGGVTIAYAVQTTVLSLPALRRLRFPEDGQSSPARDNAVRTILAALGLVAVAHLRETGLDLRSRCHLIPVEAATPIELVQSSGDCVRFTLTAEESAKLFADTVQAAKEVGVTWREQQIGLWPANRLVELVREGRRIVAQAGEEQR